MMCVDLRKRFGKTYRIINDESAQGPRDRDPWVATIPCTKGHIYPQGGARLAAFRERGPTAQRLKRLPCVQVQCDGDDGVAVVFDVADFDAVAAIMKPRRRRSLSPEQRQAASERLRLYHQAQPQKIGQIPMRATG